MKQFVVTLTAFSVSDYTRATAHTFLTNEHRFFFLIRFPLFIWASAHTRVHAQKLRRGFELHWNVKQLVTGLCVCVCRRWGGGQWGWGVNKAVLISRPSLPLLGALHVQVVRVLLSLPELVSCPWFL